MELTAPPLIHVGAATLAIVCMALMLITARGPGALLPAAVAGIVALWAVTLPHGTPARPAGLPLLAGLARDLAFLALLLTLSLRFGGRSARGMARLFAAGGAILAALAILMSTVVPETGSDILARLGLALLVVLAAENLYRNVRGPARWYVVLPAAALGGVAAFDMVLHTEMALSGNGAGHRATLRTVLAALAMLPLLLAVLRGRQSGRTPQVPHRVVFHGTTLVVAGAALSALGLAGEAARHLGAAWAPMLRAILLGLAGAGVLLALATASFRSRLLGLVRGRFRHRRFDYGREWRRCTATLSSDDGQMSEGLRAIRAIADPVGSPAGILLLAGQGAGALDLAASWNRLASMRDIPGGRALSAMLARKPDVTILAPGLLPELHATLGPLWVAVPLMHDRHGLIGAVLLAPPSVVFPLDREGRGLLRMLAREVAVVLAEQCRLRGHARQLAAATRDMKAVAGQLRRLLTTAEAGLASQDAQRELLRGAMDRIQGVVAKLSAQQEGNTPRTEPLSRLRALAAARRHPIRIEQEGSGPKTVGIRSEAFDRALGHLIDNAVAASQQGQPVRIRLRWQATRVTIDVTDHGAGMSPEFIRDELFQPHDPAGRDGMAMSTWQVRELLRAAGGDLTVLSQPGSGTAIRLALPTAARAENAAMEDRA